MSDDVLQLYLKDWGFMNSQLATLREDQLKQLINMEISGKRRETWIERLHQRYSKLVTARERAELLAGGTL